MDDLQAKLDAAEAENRQLDFKNRLLQTIQVAGKTIRRALEGREGSKE
jgi:hypothetical protein